MNYKNNYLTENSHIGTFKEVVLYKWCIDLTAVCYNTRSRRGGKEGFRDKPNLLVRNLPILMVISVNNFVTDCFLLVSLVDSFIAVLFNL